MYSQYRNHIFDTYHQSRRYFSAHPEMLIELEQFLAHLCQNLLSRNYREFEADYNEASSTAARAVVPLPMKQSSTVSPWSESILISRRGSSMGNIAS